MDELFFLSVYRLHEKNKDYPVASGDFGTLLVTIQSNRYTLNCKSSKEYNYAVKIAHFGKLRNYCE